MKLCIDGHEVYFRTLTSPEYRILRVLFTSKAGLSVHRHLVNALLQRRSSEGGVMSAEEYRSSEEPFYTSEIRILDGFELEIIDLARIIGYGVQQEDDDGD
jgi:hypothetical protein